VASFADTNENSGKKECGEGAGESGSRSRETPENHADANDEPTREPIGEKTEDGGGDHVGEEECRSQRSGPQHRVGIVRGEKRRANIWLDRGENESVDVVKKIDSEEQPK